MADSFPALTADDIKARLIALLPAGWFTDGSSQIAPVMNAVLSGAANVFAAVYNLVTFARLQSRLATMAGAFLDVAAFDYFGLVVRRRSGEVDGAFSARIRKEIFRERVTRLGMVNALWDLTGRQPSIFEPWNNGDTGCYGGVNMPMVGDGVGSFVIGESFIGYPAWCGMAYGAAGAYGSMARPAEVDVTAWRQGGGGVPGVVGYDSGDAGYGYGQIEYGTAATSTGGVQDAEIINVVNMSRPTGVKVNLSITG